MKKLLGGFFTMFTVIVLVGSVYAGPADDVAPEVGNKTRLFGASVDQGVLVCDNFGYKWSLSITGPGQCAGKVDTGGCGVWDVTGTFDAVNIQLVARNSTGNTCCKQFTYTGKHTGKQGKTASGNWSNICGGSGTWSMAICN